MNRQSASKLAGDWVVEPINKVPNPTAKRKSRIPAQARTASPVAERRVDGSDSLPDFGKHVNFERFSSLWSRIAGDDEAGAVRVQKIYANLLSHYNETHRRYHTAAHIEHCLKQIDMGRDKCTSADLVELSIWFHDAVYQPSAHDNEWQSVELFRKWASGVVSDEVVDTVERLIMVTVHDRPPVAADEKFMVDVDLSSFGLPWTDFWRDSIAVRLEQLHMDDPTFNRVQRQFLVRLLDRKSIFTSAYFRQRYESQARSNIRSYLAQLLMSQGRGSDAAD